MTEAERENLLCAIRILGESYYGREFLRWLLTETEVFTADFPRNDKVTAWQNGRRALGLQILELTAATKGNLAAVLTAEVLFEKRENEQKNKEVNNEYDG